MKYLNNLKEKMEKARHHFCGIFTVIYCIYLTPKTGLLLGWEPLKLPDPLQELLHDMYISSSGLLVFFLIILGIRFFDREKADNETTWLYSFAWCLLCIPYIGLAICLKRLYHPDLFYILPLFLMSLYKLLFIYKSKVIEYYFWGVYTGIYCTFLLYCIKRYGEFGVWWILNIFVQIVLSVFLLILIFITISFFRIKKTVWIYSHFWSIFYLIVAFCTQPIDATDLMPDLSDLCPILLFSDCIYIAPLFLRSFYKLFFKYKIFSKKKR